MTKERAIITAHRGMGVNDKPRHLLLNGSRHYAENSIAAFKEAIAQGADALECDIHVSKDNVAMVIHGSKVPNYGDYIGDNEALQLRGGVDVLEVEKKDYRQLQREFALRNHNTFIGGIEFDGLSPDDKNDMVNDASAKRSIVAQKRKLRIGDPDSYCIPTLRELLQLTFEANKERKLAEQPLLKLNIELKGRGSAVSSLQAIKAFYCENPEAVEFLVPEQLVFLGRREIGEVTIANSLLRTGKLEQAEKEFTDYFIKELLATENILMAIEELKETSTYAIWNVEEICALVACPEALKGMEASLIVKSYFDFKNGTILAELEHALEEPGALEKSQSELVQFEQAFHKPNFLAELEARGEREGFLHCLQANSDKTKDAIKGDIKKLTKQGKGKGEKGPREKVGEQVNRLIEGLTTDIYRMAEPKVPEAVKSPDDLKTPEQKITDCIISRELLKREQLVRKVRDQLKSHEGKALYDYMPTLHAIKTTLMITTGQLFGVDAVINDDFDTDPNKTEISKKGEDLVVEALTEYQYNGIDISLYDFTPRLGSIMKACGQPSGSACILGMTASNWRGTEQEGASTTPGYAVMRAEEIAIECDMPVLLKVDEAGLFKQMLDRVRSLDESAYTLGESVVLRETEMVVTSNSGMDRRESPENNMLIQKVSFKPPRGWSKEIAAERVEESKAEEQGIAQRFDRKLSYVKQLAVRQAAEGERANSFGLL